MDEATLERRPQTSPRPSDTYAQADYGRIHQELGRKGVTLKLLWEEYCVQVGDEHSADNLSINSFVTVIQMQFH
jgi:transposase